MSDIGEPLRGKEKRGPIAWMAGHSVAANLVMAVCLVGGLAALFSIRQEVFPELEVDVVTVSVAYPGASPEEVEDGVVLAVEEAVRGLDGVDEVSSTAREGVGTVNVWLLLGADVQQVAQDVTSEVDRITTFPEEAEEPEVRIAAIRRGVLDVVIHGPLEKTVLHNLGERVRDRLLQHEDITQVELEGVPPLEIGIEVPQENLRRHHLTLDDVAARLRRASVDLPGGGLKTSGGEVLVRVTERRDYGEEFARLPIITTPDGGQVRLGRIATIDDSFADTDRYARYNGELAVALEVYRVGDQTPIEVAAAVRGSLEEIVPDLPPGVKADIERDRSEYYRQRVELLVRNGALGLVLVLVVLGLFLEARLAFWVMMGIPISFLGSFLFLPVADVSINMITLFAYILALGIVVDDAIVVGENVYHYRQQGMGALRAAVKGAREVAMPVTFSILTNCVAFMPLLFIPGVMGKVFRMIPVVVVTVFLISLGECLFVLPAHLGHQKRHRRRGFSKWLHGRQQAFSRWFTKWVNQGYGPALEFALRHRYLTVAVAVALLAAAGGYAASGRMGFEMFPRVESDRSEASIVLPYGAPVERTETIARHLEQAARQVAAETGHPELVTGISTDIGRSGGHTAQIRVFLADPDVRDAIMSTKAFTNKWRETAEPRTISGVESIRFVSDAGGPGSRGRPLTVELSHRSMEVLEKASRELADTVATYPRTRDVDDGFQPGKPQLDFTVTPEGKSLGLTAREVARQVRSAFYGAEVLRQQRGRNEIKVMVRLPAADRSTEETIRDLMIRTPAGPYVPLRQVAEYDRGRAYTTIDRRKGRRVVQVSADVVPQGEAGEIIADLDATALPALVANYPGLAYSFEGHQAEMRESLGSLRVSFVVAMLVIFAMLAIPFRSYIQPLIVMISIPFGFVGAMVGHLLMGYDLSVLSMFGVVALAGVVVNDSLVLVDFANRRRREDGENHHDAVVSAGIQRFRPVLLTTLTTFGGLAPMIFETSRQARFLIPMALSLGFGILFATGITLVLVPTLYMSVEDVKRWATRVWRLGQRKPEAPPASQTEPTG